MAEIIGTGTLYGDLELILSYKSDIKSAIEAKGVDMTGLSLSDYPSAIASIQTGGNYSQLNVTENGSYSPGTYGVDAFDYVEVLVQPSLQSKSVSINGTVTPDQGYYGLSAVVVDVPQSVTGFTEKDVTEGNINITNLNNSASVVASGVFSGYQGLLTVDLPNCVTVRDNAFNNCNNLSHISLPICQYIGNGAFRGIDYLIDDIYIPQCINVGSSGFLDCWQLTSINLPNCLSIFNQAFSSCKSLTYISLPVCTSIGNSAFFRCGFTSIDLPSCTYIGEGAFQECSNLSYISINSTCTVQRSAFQSCGFVNLSTDLSIFLSQHTFRNNRKLVTVYLPECSSTVDGFFAGCHSLTSVSLPKCTYISAYTFYQCSALSFISLKGTRFIGQCAFDYCSSLDTLIIDASSVCTLQAEIRFTNSFNLYVPSSLVDVYKTALMWSRYSSQIFPIPE